MAQQKSKIGIQLLESITVGMYEDPLQSLREYVQNSLDSIRNAENEEKIIKPGEGKIEINIDVDNRQVLIKDNGTGITENEFLERLINIGTSKKTFGKDAGFRGIGRLAGIAYCDRLIFKSKYQGEIIECTLELNCRELRHEMSPDKNNSGELQTVLSSHFDLKFTEGKKDDHYFQIIMEGITKGGAQFLDKEVVNDYLSMVAPVEYDTQKFHEAPLITQYARKANIPIPTVKILLQTIDTEDQVLKPYKNTYRSSKLKEPAKIDKIQFLPEDPKDAKGFFMWYGLNSNSGVIMDNASGIRIRKDNIAIGDDSNTRDLFIDGNSSSGRFTNWAIGEIIIYDGSLIPNARRDGFEDTEPWPEIRKSLVDFCKKVGNLARSISTDTSTEPKKVLTKAREQIQKTEKVIKEGVSSEDEKQDLISILEKQKEKATRSARKKAGKIPTADQKKELETSVKQIEKQIKDIKNIKKPSFKAKSPKLDRKQEKVVSEIFAILYGKLDEKTYEECKKEICRHFKISK